MRRWTESKEITTTEVYVEALQEGARETMSVDPPPLGSEYEVKLWVPPDFPGEVCRLDEKEISGLAIQSTYYLVGRKAQMHAHLPTLAVH